jgi:hypothetical protein
MSTQLHPDGSVSIHIVVPQPWKDHIETRARKNRRSLSVELRETLRLAYRLEMPQESKHIILPEGLAKAEML